MFSSPFVPGCIAVLLTAQVACTVDGEPESANTPVQAIEVVDVVDVHDQAMAKESMSTDNQIDIARQDLAIRLGIDATEITSASISTVVWRSGALGCPKPGFSYTQALVDGVSIVLKAENTTYHYHAKTGGKPFYCPQGRVEAPAGGSSVD